jgi:hypothetical protein
LQLLTYFLSNVLVRRIKRTETLFESIDVTKFKLRPTNILDTLQHVQEPTARRLALVAKECGPLPGLDDIRPFNDIAVANDMDFPGLGHFV